MTESDDPTLRPAWRRIDRDEGEVEAPEAEEAAVDRGRTVALLATLGRMQMSLDVVARQQKSIEQRLARIERHLANPG